MSVHVTALLYQILSLHSKMLMVVKKHAELWSNITGLSVSSDSKRLVNYATMPPQLTAWRHYAVLLSFCSLVCLSVCPMPGSSKMVHFTAVITTSYAADSDVS